MGINREKELIGWIIKDIEEHPEFTREDILIAHKKLYEDLPEFVNEINNLQQNQHTDECRKLLADAPHYQKVRNELDEKTQQLQQAQAKLKKIEEVKQLCPDKEIQMLIDRLDSKCLGLTGDGYLQKSQRNELETIVWTLQQFHSILKDSNP